jgi:precorrin-6A/cobalt-precorrin-6A reductase
MSRNALAATTEAGIPVVALERPAWSPSQGDRWTRVTDTVSAVTALPDIPARVFLAIGRQTLEPFAAKPHHHYLLRLVDRPEGTLPLRDCQAVIARGPFTVDGDLALLQAHRITHIVAKNSGGDGARAKLFAARQLGLPVILIDRPALPGRDTCATPEDILAWLHARLGV